ncbi:MAG: hypothetical protein ACWA6X_09975 [Bauldia sp.]
MDAKQAAESAKKWLIELLADEGPVNIGLEEIEFDERSDRWNVTLGFSRPWNAVRDAFTVISGESASRRAYRVLTVDNEGGFVSMKRRENELQNA